MPHFTAPAPPGTDAMEWDGDLAAGVTTQAGDRMRWVEFRVYDTPDAERWLLWVAGCSAVYHREDTKCRTKRGAKPGGIATVDDLPDYAEPCPQCRPRYPENIGDAERVRFEFPRSTFTRSADAAKIVETLATSRNRDTGYRTVRVSDPVNELLTMLEERYPEFAAVPRPAEGVFPPLPQGDDNDGPANTGHQPGRGAREAS